METGPFSLGFGTYCALAKRERVFSSESEEDNQQSNPDRLREKSVEENE
ncbi:hypothetical protein [Candidatus Nitrospira salsa]